MGSDRGPPSKIFALPWFPKTTPANMGFGFPFSPPNKLDTKLTAKTTTLELELNVFTGFKNLRIVP